jgi:hypothetical protein
MIDKQIYITKRDYQTLFDLIKLASEYNEEDAKYLK